MISWLVKTFINDSENVSVPNVKKDYAALSSVVGIVLNQFLCTAKILIGLCNHSIAISADGGNNLSDAGTSFLSFLGFRIARYTGGTKYLFWHGRIEWIMSIFTSVSVMLMGLKLASAPVTAIHNPGKPIFSVATIVVLVGWGMILGAAMAMVIETHNRKGEKGAKATADVCNQLHPNGKGFSMKCCRQNSFFLFNCLHQQKYHSIMTKIQQGGKR